MKRVLWVVLWSWTAALGLTEAQTVVATPPPGQSDAPDPTSPKKKAAGSGQLDTLVVSDSALTSTDIAEHDLAQVPGGTNLIKGSDAEQGRALTTADLFANQAGVFAQAAGGNPAIKISIRGSGINTGTGFFRSGVHFLFDGLPITGPGGTPYELFEPLGLAYTEVLRGANAFNYQPLAMGGAINYVTDTGHDASPFQARFEAGSFGYYKGQVSSGLVEGKFDYYASATQMVEQGYQNHSEAEATHIIANVGAQITPDIDNRIYFRFGHTEDQRPGGLTKAQIKSDPTQANPTNVANNSHRTEPGSEWVADKLTIKVDQDSQIEAAAVFHNYPIKAYTYNVPGATNDEWWYDTASLVLRYSRSDTLFGLQSNTQVGFSGTTDVAAGEKQYDSSHGATYQNLIRNYNFDGSTDSVLSVSNDTELVPNLWMTTALAGVYVRRVNEISLPVNYRLDYGLLDYEPRLAFRYDLNENVEFFTSLSRSVEPPEDWALRNAAAINGHVAYGSSNQLKNQTSTTVEAGTKARAGIFSGSVDVYRSWVDNELLTVAISQSPLVTATSNATPTIHQGVEVTFDTTLWQEKGLPASSQPHQVVLQQTYSYSDFHYADDALYGQNKLPGVPPHYYQAELRYQHPSGFYAGVNTQIATAYNVDYAATVATDDYALLGFDVGYAPAKKGWEAHINFNNVTNEHYATAISPVYNLGGNANSTSAAALNPGDGFGIFGGASYSF